MTTEQQQTVAGIVLRGVDAGLYFIPDAVLEAFHLTDEAATQVQQVLAEQADTQGMLFPVPGGIGPIALTPIKMPREPSPWRRPPGSPIPTQ